MIAPKSRFTVRPAPAMSSTFVTNTARRSSRYVIGSPSALMPTNVPVSKCWPVAAIVSSGASAVLLSRVSVSGEKVAFPASLPPPSISKLKLLTSNQLSPSKSNSPATPSSLSKYLEADANALSVPSVKPSENGAISVWLVTS